MSVSESRLSRQRRKALDAAFDAYLEWRMRCDAVHRTYTQWSRARDDAAIWACGAYERALNREESAANMYAVTMTRVAELVRPHPSRSRTDVRPGCRLLVVIPPRLLASG
jgi:hypothetical protein